MQLTAGRRKIVVSVDGTGMVSMAGGLLLVQTLRLTGLDRRLDFATAATPVPARTRRPPQALPRVLGVSPGWQKGGPSHPVIEIAISPDLVRLAAHNLQAPDTGHPGVTHSLVVNAGRHSR